MSWHHNTARGFLRLLLLCPSVFVAVSLCISPPDSSKKDALIWGGGVELLGPALVPPQTLSPEPLGE